MQAMSTAPGKAPDFKKVNREKERETDVARSREVIRITDFRNALLLGGEQRRERERERPCTLSIAS